MKKSLPEKFISRLKQIIPEDKFENVLKTFENPRPVCARINTIKISKEDLLKKLASLNIAYEEQDFYPNALQFSSEIKTNAEYQQLLDQGLLYSQNFSSMLPVIILDPQENETILDACAAPGSKTSQIAMHMMMEQETRHKIQDTDIVGSRHAVTENMATACCGPTICAVDAISKRVYKLRSVLELLGVTNVEIACCDVRHYDSKERLFDKILVDAPCSSEGRFHLSEPKSFAFWSERKIKEMAHKQKGILLSASRLLKSGGRLVYSTCSFSPDENEEVIDWFLRKSGGEFELEDVNLNGIERYSSLLEWGKRKLNPEVSKTVRVLPNGKFEGFFVALLRNCK